MATGTEFVYLQSHATRIFRCFGIPTCLRQGCWEDEVIVKDLLFLSAEEKRTQPLQALSHGRET
jgi:hypothetical protein